MIVATKDTRIDQVQVTVGGVDVTVRTFTQPDGKVQVWATAGEGWVLLRGIPSGAADEQHTPRADSF